MSIILPGGGISAGRFRQLFLLVMLEGKRKSADLTHVTGKILFGQGQRIIKEGNTMEELDDNIQKPNTLTDRFLTTQLTVLKKLKIAQIYRFRIY